MPSLTVKTLRDGSWNENEYEIGSVGYTQREVRSRRDHGRGIQEEKRSSQLILVHSENARDLGSKR
jgi:hypothetical protein